VQGLDRLRAARYVRRPAQLPCHDGPAVQPLTKKLAGRSPSEVADLLERHVGTDRSPQRCREAAAALREHGLHSANLYVRAAIGCLARDGDGWAALRNAIRCLRNRRHLSGA
jgi:hypothetical protein